MIAVFAANPSDKVERLSAKPKVISVPWVLIVFTAVPTALLENLLTFSNQLLKFF
jgi:hypothetical protein